MLVALELGSTPIAEDRPFGEDPKESVEYESMLAEIAKIASLQGAESVNWNTVSINASEILANKAKDLHSAVYLSIALSVTDSIEGWHRGTCILKDVLDIWWENAFPPIKRIKGRINIIDWWHEYSLKFLNNFKEELEYGFVQELKETLRNIDDIIAEKLPDAQALHDMHQAVKRLNVKPQVIENPVQEQIQEKSQEGNFDETDLDNQSVQKNDSSPVLKAEQSSEHVATNSQNQAPQQTLATEQFTGQFTEQFTGQFDDYEKGKTALISIAKQYFFLCLQNFENAFEDAQVNTQNVFSDRFTWQAFYMTVWGNLKVLPLSENNQTMIAAPQIERIEALYTLFESAKFKELIKACVSFAPEVPFCLDIHYLLHEAFKALGATFESALQVQEQEIAAFMKKFRGTENLCFSDETPFASTDTKQRFQELAKKYNESQNSQENGVSINPLITETRAFTANCIAQKDFVKALEKMHQVSQSLHGKDYILVRLDEIRLLLRQKQAFAAKALGVELEYFLDMHKLEKWDTCLSQEILITLRDICKAQEQTDETKKKLVEILEKLYRINPSLAL